MPGKPTYRELEQQIHAMHKEIEDHKVFQEALLMREQHYRVILEGTGENVILIHKG